MRKVAYIFLHRLGLQVLVLQAPIAGVSSPEMAAAVTEAGGLGERGLGACKPEQARDGIELTHG